MLKEKKIKILSVFGTRPEAIKLAPVIHALNKNKKFILKICVTGQHKEMLDQALNFFSIQPDYNLEVMAKNQKLSDISSKILKKITPILIKEKPDMVLVQGDTNTAFAGALASYYMHIPVGHIEAGLRTGDLYQPFPEEGNRILISRLATLNFAPTKLNYNNLIKDNINKNNIVITGNTVIDSLFFTLKICQSRKLEYWKKYFKDIYEILTSNKKIILVTGHRRENFGKGFIDITNAIKKIAKENPEVEIIYPVHLNPNVQNPVNNNLGNIKNVHLIQPLEYEPFVYLMNRSYVVLTDSGGVQEEAPSLGKPVIVMREKTERIEAVESGTVILTGTNEEKIFKETNRLINDYEFYNKMSKIENPYGNGFATERIIESLIKFFNKKTL